LKGITPHFDREHFKNRVKKYEGEVLHLYLDKAGIITIGCGFNMEKHTMDHPNDPCRSCQPDPESVQFASVVAIGS
jgi:hypothetical protein